MRRRALQPRTNPDAPPLFTLRGVSLERAGTMVLRDLTVDIPRTAITAVVGPSGAGKTSMLRLLNRLDDPTSGELEFDGRPITSYPVAALRRRVGFVFQTPAMFAGSVADNLRIAVELGGEPAASEALPIDRVLTGVELSPEYASREAARLSGGEQQRVSLARAIMTRPRVLLLDEPTAALDPEVAERLLATIARVSAEYEVSVVMITHRLAEARDTSMWTIMLEAGRLVEAGPTERLFSAAASERTRRYLATAE